MSRLTIGVAAVLLLAAACSGSNEEATVASTIAESTSIAAPATSTTITTTTAVPATTTTTTTQPPKEFPSSGLIAFSSDRAGTGALFVVDTADGEIRQIAFGLETMLAPAWSPDGRRIAYVALSGRPKLMLIDVAAAWDGEVEPIELTDGSLDVDQPGWSADGTTIAFKVTNEDGVAEVWSIAVEGGEPERLMTNAERPAFSPDGQFLAYVEVGERESAIAVLDLQSGDTNRLTDPAERGVAPSWSPDASQIAYTAGTANLDIWMVAAVGGEPAQLTAEADREWWPCWTGAGEIAYARFSPDNLHDIWLVDLVGGSMAPLVESPSDNWFPACQPIQ